MRIRNRIGVAIAVAITQRRSIMKEDTYKLLFAELEKYEDSGVSMKLNNYPASPMQIVTAHMVKENPAYMRDYVWDEKGHIRELTFHTISDS